MNSGKVFVAFSKLVGFDHRINRAGGYAVEHHFTPTNFPLAGKREIVFYFFSRIQRLPGVGTRDLAIANTSTSIPRSRIFTI